MKHLIHIKLIGYFASAKKVRSTFSAADSRPIF